MKKLERALTKPATSQALSEKERKNKLRNEVIKTAAGYVAMAAVFFAGVLSAKKYFKK